MRAFIALVLCVAAFLARAEVASDSLSSMAEYARWVKPWAERSATNSAGLKAVITIVSGEVPLSTVTNMTPVERLNLAYHLKIVGSEITTNGSCRCFFTSNTDAESAPRQLSANSLKQLDELLASLPDDDMTLPPPGRRVVVQVPEQDHWRVRVYDLGAAPAEVRAILALVDNPFDKSL